MTSSAVIPAGMNGVQIGPGMTPFTRMPFSASSCARLTVRLPMRALGGGIGEQLGLGRLELTEAVLMMRGARLHVPGDAALVR